MVREVQAQLAKEDGELGAWPWACRPDSEERQRLLTRPGEQAGRAPARGSQLCTWNGGSSALRSACLSQQEVYRMGPPGQNPG